MAVVADLAPRAATAGISLVAALGEAVRARAVLASALVRKGPRPAGLAGPLARTAGSPERLEATTDRTVGWRRRGFEVLRLPFAVGALLAAVPVLRRPERGDAA